MDKQADIKRVQELRKTGMSRAKIVKATGLPERFVREHMQSVEQVATQRTGSSKSDKAVSKAYPLAVRVQGCKAHELRSIMHSVYGTVWCPKSEEFVANYTSSTMSRVKQKVVALAVENKDYQAVFLPDWVDDGAPTASRLFLEDAAACLSARLNEYVAEFMHLHGDETPLGSSKQLYAAKEYILKLAFRTYGAEPVEQLMKRTKEAVDNIEGIALDVPLDAPIQHPLVVEESVDAFVDYVESREWMEQLPDDSLYDGLNIVYDDGSGYENYGV